MKVPSGTFSSQCLSCQHCTYPLIIHTWCLISRPAVLRGVYTLLQAEDKPGMIMELKVSMEAPNITMPRSSDSNDAIEVDLGSLQLRNAVAWRNGNSVKNPDVRFDVQCSLLTVTGVPDFWLIE